MTSYITVFPESSKEYERLNQAAKILSMFSTNEFHVQTTYFDFGQNWLWTTIICKTNTDEYQFLNPYEHEIIVSGSYAEYMDCIKKLLEKH